MHSRHSTVHVVSRREDALLLFSRGLACLLMVASALVLPQPAAAQLASKSAQEWIKTLESSNRVERLKIDETIAQLKIKPGEVIADIGAGSGLYSLPLAKAASPGGMVYAVDIEQGLLDHIATRAKELQLTNLQMVLGKFADPNLPSTNVDLAFINDVLHHIEDRAGYLKSLARYLKPTGRVVIIDFYPELGPHKNDPSLQVTKNQAASWMAAIGFKPVEQFSLFKDKWFVVYSR
ncbi:MAG TPA: methyltransferase domain-containing protein [Verrucomicrobiae bacterium]|nr:methyltransferase domain-containing protein [Verrucomicrobiae bacterium]